MIGVCSMGVIVVLVRAVRLRRSVADQTTMAAAAVVVVAVAEWWMLDTRQYNSGCAAAP